MGATLAFGVSVLVEPTVRRGNAKFGTGSYFEIFLRITAPARYYLQMEMKLVAGKKPHLRARRELVARVLAKVLAKLGHIGDHDLERYHLGMVKDEAELAALEEHLLWCGACVDRAEATARYVDAVRAQRVTSLSERYRVVALSAVRVPGDERSRRRSPRSSFSFLRQAPHETRAGPARAPPICSRTGSGTCPAQDIRAAC